MACAASEPKMANCVANSRDWYILTRFGNTESQLNGCSLFTDTCKFSKSVTVWSSWSVFPLNFYTLGGSPGQRNLVLLSDRMQNCILELRCLFFWSSLLWVSAVVVAVQKSPMMIYYNCCKVRTAQLLDSLSAFRDVDVQCIYWRRCNVRTCAGKLNGVPCTDMRNGAEKRCSKLMLLDLTTAC